MGGVTSERSRKIECLSRKTKNSQQLFHQAEDNSSVQPCVVGERNAQPTISGSNTDTSQRRHAADEFFTDTRRTTVVSRTPSSEDKNSGNIGRFFGSANEDETRK